MRQEFLQQLIDYLNGRYTIQEFEAWMLSNLGVILNSGDGELIDMANDIDADFMEFSEGIINEKVLKERLMGYLVREEAEKREGVGESLTTNGTIYFKWGAE